MGNKILLRGWIHIYVSIIRLLVFEYDVKTTCSRFSKGWKKLTLTLRHWLLVEQLIFQDKQCVQKQQGAFGIQIQLSRNNSHTKYGSSYNAHHLRIFNKYFPILQVRIFQQVI